MLLYVKSCYVERDTFVAHTNYENIHSIRLDHLIAKIKLGRAHIGNALF